MEGLEHIPQSGAFILAVNHSSHADTAVIFAALARLMRKRVVAAAAQDYFFDNGLRQFASRMLFNTIPVPRTAFGSSDPLRHVVRALREGYGVLLFPEGTRSPSGQLGPFRSGIGRLAAEVPTCRSSRSGWREPRACCRKRLPSRGRSRMCALRRPGPAYAGAAGQRPAGASDTGARGGDALTNAQCHMDKSSQTATGASSAPD